MKGQVRGDKHQIFPYCVANYLEIIVVAKHFSNPFVECESLKMYPYHNKNKQRIKNKELISYEYVEKYKSISPCLLLHFSTEPKIRPIREHRFNEYEALFKSIS